MHENKSINDGSSILARAAEQLAFASKLEQITAIVAKAARELSRADGATFVLRDENKCYYADENAISPLWKGKRFPMEACISGWAMTNGKVAYIPDIYRDDRIPHGAYRPTFVKSLYVVPIRPSSPLGAIGNYWADTYLPADHEKKMLQMLANCAAVAIENWELREAIRKTQDLEVNLKQNQDRLETSMHTLAHDLRSPVSSILAFANLLQSHFSDQLDKTGNRYLTSILNIGTHANGVIGQMLALHKLAAQELAKQEIDLTIIGLELESQIRAQNAHRNIRFEIDEEMSAFGDPILVRQAIENLLTNAVKFSQFKDPALIRFGSKLTGDGSVLFFVQDNGVGFDPRETKKLFKPKVRLHDENEFQGTGLGLASFARIMEIHGGTYHAEGRMGEGATFFFTLPGKP